MVDDYIDTEGFSSTGRVFTIFIWTVLGILLAAILTATLLELVAINPPQNIEWFVAERQTFLDAIPAGLEKVDVLKEQFLVYLDFYLKVFRIYWVSWFVFISVFVSCMLVMQGLRRFIVLMRYQKRIAQYENLYKKELIKKESLEKDASKSRQFLLEVHEYISESFLIVGRDERLIHANQRALDHLILWAPFAETFQQLEGQKLQTFIPNYKDSGFSKLINTVIKTKSHHKEELQITEGQWVSVRVYPARDEVFVYFRDISGSKNPQQRYDNADVILQTLLSSSPFSVAVTDINWRYLVASESWVENFKLPENVIGKNHKEVLPSFPGKWKAIESVLSKGKVVQSDESMFHLNGQEEWINWQIRPWMDGEHVGGYILYALIVTESKENRDKLIHQRERERKLAYHDVLTGLPNRQLFYDRLNMSLAQAYRQLDKVGLMFLDLDGFKAVNDKLGHDVGDMLLKEVSTRVQKCVRDSDTVARLGGDEFTVILNGIADEKDAAFVANKIIESVNLPFQLGQNTVKIGTSIGISLYPLDGSVSSELIKKADTAMYWAKESGKNTYKFFSDDVEDEGHAGHKSEVNVESDLANDMKTALQKGEFELNFQPQYDLNERKVFGMEALLRWNHPEKGRLRPKDFLEVAESTGLILPIGEWVVKTACARMSEWIGSGHEPLQVSVNLSPRQLQDESLYKRLNRSFEETGLDAKYFALEISEKTIMENEEDTKARLQKLKDLGVTVMVDDFGIGFTPLNNLKDFPVDVIKIHRSFVQRAPQSAEDGAIVKTMINLATNMGLKVIAEGVETDEQTNFLVTAGCNYVQGYLFGKPVHPRDVPEFFKPLSSEDMSEE